MTLKEYLEDYASDETKKIGEELIKKELATFVDKKIECIVEKNLNCIENGQRDFRF